MGPEPIIGGLAWLGLVILAVASVLLWRKRRARPYVIFSMLPGIALAIEGVQGQVGVVRSLGVFLMFFAVGSLIIGVPLAGLGWWWLNRPGSRPGTLE